MQHNSVNGAVMAVDIGNTNINCGIYREGELAWSARLSSSPLRTADEHYGILKSLLSEAELRSLRAIGLASVVPELTRVWQHLLQKYTQAPVTEINALSPLGLTYKVDDPSTVGADLVANAFGAWKKYAAPCIIVDLGTATTIQLVTATGKCEGVVIAPGLKTAAENLFGSAALLTPVEIRTPETLLGTNTRDALLSGIVYGHAFMLQAMLQRLKTQYFELKDIVTIATGGISDLVKPLVPALDVVDRTLTLDGIWLAWRYLAQA